MRSLNDNEIVAVLLIQDVDAVGFSQAVNIVFGREASRAELEEVNNRICAMRRQLLSDFPAPRLD